MSYLISDLIKMIKSIDIYVNKYNINITIKKTKTHNNTL